MDLETFEWLLDILCQQPYRSNTAITFDDGHWSHSEIVLPALQKRGLVATFFLVTSWVGTSGYLTWDEARALLSSGMAIGSHTVSHRVLAGLNRHEVKTEFEISKAYLEDRLAAPVTSLSLPGGYAPRSLRQLALQTGYRRIYTSAPGWWDGSSILVPRICLRQGVSVATACDILRGRTTPYVLSERTKSLARLLLGHRVYSLVRTVLRSGRR